MSLNDADSTAAIMQERAKVDDNVASAVLNAASQNRATKKSGSDNAEDAPSDAKLDIFAAAQKGEIELIRTLIESGRARATDKDNDDITPLHWAAINGQAETCTYLLEQGAEVNAIGGTIRATPLHWATRQGLVRVMDILIQHGADPRLLDGQGYSSLHTVTHSSSYWALLYLLCRPKMAIDEPDRGGHTPLHWAAYQRHSTSIRILLNLGANPNAVDHKGLTPLHWAAFTGDKRCITKLLEAGADIRMKNNDLRTAEDMASEFRHGDVWNEVVGELGIKADGSRRRPLSEPGVNIIAFAVPIVALGISFMIAGVFPWYLSIVLSPAAFFVICKVVTDKVLQKAPEGSLDETPFFIGLTVGSALWVVYAWITRLRYVAHSYPSLHVAFLFSFVIFVLSFRGTTFCDPGACIVSTKDDLKSITEDLVRSNRLTDETFCVRCMAVKPPHTTHCSMCKKCVTHHPISPGHSVWHLNCIGKKNHFYFIVFVASITAGILIFDYLVWIHFRNLKHSPTPARFCLLPRSVCGVASADTFLVSIAVWSTLHLWWSVMLTVLYAVGTWNVVRRKMIDTFQSIVPRAY